jgi:hypothetical protein
MASYAALLDAAKTAYLQILGGVAVEWSEGGHRVRVADPKQMLDIIERLEVLSGEEAGGTCLRPICSVDP